MTAVVGPWFHDRHEYEFAPGPRTHEHRHRGIQKRDAAPSGQRLPDHLWPELLVELLSLGSNRVALIHADGSHEEMDEENLIPATRAAVRASNTTTMEEEVT